MKLSREILECLVHCPRKAHLRLSGEASHRSDYEALRLKLRREARRIAPERIHEAAGEETVLEHVSLCADTLRTGPRFIVDGRFDSERMSVSFDALERVAGASRIGPHHYVPMLFSEDRRVSRPVRQLAEILGLLLSNVQGRLPAFAVVWCGIEGRRARVRFRSDLRTAEETLRKASEMVDGGDPPSLVLNDHCSICEFQQACEDRARQEDHISLLRGMPLSEIERNAKKGIFTVSQLAHTFRPRRKGKRQLHRARRRYYALQAIALRDQRVYVFGTPEVPSAAAEIYLDLEGDPDAGYVYLIGALIVDGGTETRRSFWADTQGEEVEIFEEFLAALRPYPDFLVFSYGAYEGNFLKRMRTRVADTELVDRLLGSVVNVLSVIYAHVYFPTCSNGLKEVGAFLGCRWTDPDASGLQSIVWRHRWITEQDEVWKTRLLRYNMEDCVALRRVRDFIGGLADHEHSPSDRGASDSSPSVASVGDLDRLANNLVWGRVDFFHRDYETINACAYFDYQRERVFVRSSKSLKRRRRTRRRKGQRLKLRASRQIQIKSSRCPECGARTLTTDIPRKEISISIPRLKRAYDLVLSPSGIKRRVLDCRTAVHRCLACDHEFAPERHRRLDKHWHGLKAWVVYQHVAHRLSLKAVGVMLEEFFGLRISPSELHGFKHLMARYYRSAYRASLKRILSGGLLHVDETRIKLRTGTGYVWVFADLEDVAYVYRPTREGGFLREWLKDFHGVLVSDFFNIYDSLDCPQQKCLIHLIRDLNQELLSHPYDEELQSITQPFGVLLRKVVETVDRSGLRRRSLRKHKRAISHFFTDLDHRSVRSKAAESVRDRLLRNRTKLFTFVDHDGVPWNNNVAENAIKRFAFYRARIHGIMKEEGLTDYLVLLSLFQACRLRDVSFLRFLASGHRTLDGFCANPRKKARMPRIQVYPKGYVPAIDRLHPR